MKIKVQIVIESEDKNTETVEDIALLERGSLQPAGLGITLAEAKTILASMQKTMVERQTTEYFEQQACCPFCGKKRLHKGHHTLVYRTLFGKLRFPSVRLYHCVCQPHPTRTFSTPGPAVIRTDGAGIVVSGDKVFISDVLRAFSAAITGGAANRRWDQCGNRSKSCAYRWPAHRRRTWRRAGVFYRWLRAGLGATAPAGYAFMVGLDGGYVHSNSQSSRKKGWFEVIAGKSVTDDGASKRFAFVNNYDEKPKRRVFEVLKSQGMQSNQQVTFLSDGGDTVRDLQLYLNPNAEHLLDWFHITMRITVMRQMAKGLGVAGTESREIALKEMERIRWFLWHGNVFRALETMDNLAMDLDPEEPTAKEVTLLKKLEEFETYIRNNAGFIVNYGERWRYGETISTAFVESTVNQVVSKRMVKKQQMRWSQKGAHLLLQVRTRVLNDELRDVFRQWYPSFSQGDENQRLAA